MLMIILEKKMKIRTYNEMLLYPTFSERFDYLRLDGSVGEETFGFDRIFNQMFYRSKEWKHTRDKIITRDLGRDMALEDFEIYGRIYIHHMNPITLDDISNSTPYLMDPNYLVCVSQNTHNAIHYGIKDVTELFPSAPVERRPNDQCPWR